MPDYSTYRRCQWIVWRRPSNLWFETERPTLRHGLCRNRARFLLGECTWLCWQHNHIAVEMTVGEILKQVVTGSGRPLGQL
jgi:hypothetical protein